MGQTRHVPLGMEAIDMAIVDEAKKREDPRLNVAARLARLAFCENANATEDFDARAKVDTIAGMLSFILSQ